MQINPQASSVVCCYLYLNLNEEVLENPTSTLFSSDELVSGAKLVTVVDPSLLSSFTSSF